MQIYYLHHFYLIHIQHTINFFIEMSTNEKKLQLYRSLLFVYAASPYRWNNGNLSIITFGYTMKLIFFDFFAVILTGCAKQSFDLDRGHASATIREEIHHFFLSGLGQKKIINAAEICGGADRVYRTETQLTFMNGLLNVITFGIYTPQEATVYCSTQQSNLHQNG